MDDLFLYNGQDCTFWLFDVFTDAVYGGLLFIEDDQPMNGILSLSYSMHKAPIMYYSCYTLFYDFQEIVSFFESVVGDSSNFGPYAIKIFWNLLFNWADLDYEFKTFVKEIENKDWVQIGVYISKI